MGWLSDKAGLMVSKAFSLAMCSLVVSCGDHRAFTEDKVIKIEGVGVFRNSKPKYWTGAGSFDGKEVELEFATYDSTQSAMISYVKETMSTDGITREILHRHLAKGIKGLDWKFKQFGETRMFLPDEFTVKSMYFHQHEDREAPGLIIVLKHSSDNGHWSLELLDQETTSLIWVPKT
ncbi:MAG: hypothetical protein ACPGVU_07350 [Limisphaerales bacterium]